MRRLSLAAALALLWTPAALADDVALALGTGDYRNVADLPGSAVVVEAVDGLVTLGFDVSVSANGDAEAIRRALAGFMEDVPDADRLVVALAGRFVTDGERTWYLTRDAGRPGLFGLGDTAISVESVMQVLARVPSRAILLLGVDPRQETVYDPWLREGIGELDIPQGVTVLTGTPANVASFMADELSVPRGDLSRLVTANQGISAQGYLPRGFVFTPAIPATRPNPQAARAEENALWQGAVALDTVEAYRNYLRAYPQGRYAAQAQQGIDAILAEPNREARLAEEALELTRDQRRAIQRNLTLLEFDPRGIDGIFGPGTRRAITNWQQQNGFAQTGYLDREQVARLEGQAARRAAQLEAEAQRQRQAVQAADRAYWEETGARGDEAGLRAYLERYPDGLFAETAADRIALIEAENRQAAQAQDRAAWDQARGADTVVAYQRYLERFPQGQFVEEARARRNQLVRESDRAEERADARQAEEALGLNSLTSRVIEQRLDALGLDPGAVDGAFDQDTRRALRNYQRDRGLEATGFLDEATLVRLLADTLGEALDGD